MPDWQPIATAPRDGTEFIGWHNDKACPALGAWFTLAWYSEDERWPWEDAEGKHPPAFLTHWMPLPPLPENA